MEKSLIVAISDNYAIGKGNALLWHISDDLKYFKQVTLGSPVIMGRKTFESIGRPLPKRLNIVISRSDSAPEASLLSQWISKAPECLVLVHSLEEAWQAASKWLVKQNSEKKEAFVIGGGEVYHQALSQVEKMYVTHVHTIIEDADTFFPMIDQNHWHKEKVSETLVDPETSYSFDFVTYSRN